MVITPLYHTSMDAWIVLDITCLIARLVINAIRTSPANKSLLAYSSLCKSRMSLGSHTEHLLHC